MKYPVQIHWIDEDEGNGYYCAFLPDFGHSACSATGDTVEEALKSLEIVKRDVVQVYSETGGTIPEPSGAPWEEE
jgi:predicted RNase H-like HicB family nuclease